MEDELNKENSFIKKAEEECAEYKIKNRFSCETMLQSKEKEVSLG